MYTAVTNKMSIVWLLRFASAYELIYYLINWSWFCQEGKHPFVSFWCLKCSVQKGNILLNATEKWLYVYFEKEKGDVIISSESFLNKLHL